MYDIIRAAIDQEARIVMPAQRLAADDNLYEAGLTLYAAVRVLLALERATGLRFSRNALSRETTRSIGAIAQALDVARASAA